MSFTFKACNLMYSANLFFGKFADLVMNLWPSKVWAVGLTEGSLIRHCEMKSLNSSWK